MQRWTALVLALVGLSVISIIIARSRSSLHNIADSEPATRTEASQTAATSARVPVVVELFTSEGCSSCPPADELLKRLAETQPVAGAQVIALEQHVDYWNRLGWTDPFSAEQFSARQGAYADTFGSSDVYTPQMIIDGQTEFPGGNQTRAREAIANAARTPKASITLALGGAPKPEGVPLSVRVEKLPATNADDTIEVLLAITEDGLRTDVPSGENAGRSLTHAAVVRELSPLGQIGPRDASPFAAQPVVALSAKWQAKNLRAVVLLQEHTSRRVVGATAIKLSAE
jgi:hypothetical protein